MIERPLNGRPRYYRVRVGKRELAFWSPTRLRRGDQVIVRGGLLDGDGGVVVRRMLRFPRCGYAYRVQKGVRQEPAQALAEAFDAWADARGIEPDDAPEAFAVFLGERLGRPATGRRVSA